MSLWVEFTNVVTIGNLATITTLICAFIYFYFKIRRYFAKQHIDFLVYLDSLTKEQTAHIEACIHQVPGHPENPESPIP